MKTPRFADPPANPLAGSWELKALGRVLLRLTFEEDGSLEARFMGRTAQGRYSLRGDRITLIGEDPRLFDGAGFPAGEQRFSVSDGHLSLGGLRLTRADQGLS